MGMRMIDAGAIERKLKKQYCAECNVVRQIQCCACWVNDVLELLEGDTVDAVSRGVLDQVKWERDIALEQLADYGISLGERADVVKVVRCKDCKHWHEETGWCDVHSHFVDRLGDFCYPEESGDWKEFDGDYFCNDGERKET